MSLYSGNQTNGRFNPTYAVDGETKTPVNVVSTSMKIDGEMVQGYQATYANGTSKWTPHVLTDTPIFDSQNKDRSTFTGTKNADGKWQWQPTSDTSVRTLARNYRGENNERITEGEIERDFYNRSGNTIQEQLSTLQAEALKAEYSDDLTTVDNGRFSNLTAIQQAEDQQFTSADGTVETDSEASGAFTFSSAAETTKIRTKYGNYYYPQDISSNKQDRIIFKQRMSTGQIIDPLDVKRVGSRQRKTNTVEGSVTLPITSGIKDLNSVSWQGSTMNPLQAFAASAATGVFEEAGTEGGDPLGALGTALGDAASTVTENKGVQKAISTMIAGQAAQTKNLLSRATGAIANPNMELLFDAPALRAFDYTFQMSPRDGKEAEQIRNIINFFKQGMAVKTTSTNIFLKAPNYFEIDYVSFNDNGEMMKHPSINIIKTCALLSCAVDYTPNNSYMTYSDPQRSMVQYTMNLQFNELEPVLESDYFEGLGMQNGTNVQEIGF